MANQKTVSVENDVARATTTLTDKMPTLPLNGPQGRRAIGPRVTFHFISDPWSSANTYEGYDVVQVDGVSYVAIQPVPTGIQLDNTQYWFKWSEPNAQWAELLATVQSFDGRITQNTSDISELSKKPTMVAFGDSWGTVREQTTSPWPVLVADMMGYNLENFCVGGHFWTRDIKNDIQSAVVEDVENVKLGVIVAGVNDVVGASLSADYIMPYITDAVTTFKSKFPNAQLVVCPQNAPYFLYGNGDSGVNRYSLAFKNNEYFNQHLATNADAIYAKNTPLYVTGNQGLYYSDNIHPTQDGSNVLAKHIYDAIHGYDAIDTPAYVFSLGELNGGEISFKVNDYNKLKFTDEGLFFPYFHGSNLHAMAATICNIYSYGFRVYGYMPVYKSDMSAIIGRLEVASNSTSPFISVNHTDVDTSYSGGFIVPSVTIPFEVND